MSAAIELVGVGKRYQQTTRAQTLAGRLADLGRRRARSEMWALRDVDLTVEQGETIGVIGRNGSGKTTMLRLLSGVSAPSAGRLRVVGRVAPLIGIGVGFNNELTGRENVSVNGRLLGMSAADVRRDFDSIVAFSEIEKFIDTPVKFYSSGMFLRLAFAVAIHTSCDVLVVDEILAVGDQAFQAKCMERMREIQAAGTTIVIVTHNLHTLDRTAARAVLLSGGRVAFDGPTEQAIGRMYEIMEEESRERGAADVLLQEGGAAYTGGAEVSARIVDASGAPRTVFDVGEDLAVELTATFTAEVEDPVVGVMVARAGLGVPLYFTFGERGSYRGHHGPDRPLTARLAIRNRLLPGGYTVSVSVQDADGAATLGAPPPLSFYVGAEESGAFGLVDLDVDLVVEGQRVAKPLPKRLGSRIGG